MMDYKDITAFLAESYFDAAAIESDMHETTDVLEAIRVAAKDGLSTKKIEELLTDYLGKNIENEKVFQIIFELRKKIQKLKISLVKKEILKIFEKNQEKGWLQWLELFGKELSENNRNYCKAILEIKVKVPASKRSNYNFIKTKFKPYYDELWVESLPLFEFFIKHKHIPAQTKADLHEIAGQVELYHILDFKNAFEHFSQIKSLIPNSAKSYKVFAEYYIQKREFDKAEKEIDKSMELDDEDYDNYRVFGGLYQKQKKLETAEAWYLQGLRKHPGELNLYHQLIKLNEHEDYFNKHHEEIDDVIAKIAKIEPEFVLTPMISAGYAYQKNGDLNKAKAYYQKIIKKYPDRIQGHLNLGYAYLDANEYKKSEQAFLKVVELRKKSYDGYWGLVALFRKRKKWEDVILNLNMAKKYRPKWQMYFYNDLGDAYEKLGDIKNAILNYLLAIESDPERSLSLNALLDIASFHLELQTGIELLKKVRTIKGDSFEGKYHHELGVLYYKKGLYTNALEHFLNAEKQYPDSGNLTEYLGLSYEKAAQFDKAEAYYRKTIQNNPENSKYYNRLGFFLTNIGRSNEAIELLDKAIDLNAYPYYFENRGYAYEKNKNFDAALKDYKNALKLAESERDVYENRLGIYYKNQNNYTKAIEYYTSAIAINPKAVYYENLALAFQYQQKYSEAEKAYEKAIKLASPEQKEIYWNAIGLLYYDQKKDKEAIKYYQKAIDLNPKKAVYHANQGLSYRFLKRWKKSLEAYQKAIKLDKNNASYFDKLGLAARNLKEWEQSEKAYRKAIKLEPGNGIFWNALGLLYYDQKKDKEAIECYQKAIDWNSNNALFHANQGLSFYYLKQWKNCLAAYQKASELDNKNTKYLDYIGIAARNLKEWELSEKAFRKAIKIEPGNGMYLNGLGILYYTQKKDQEAIKYYQKAIELNPNIAVYHANLGLSLGYLTQWEDCVKAYQKATDLNKENASNYNYLGLAAGKVKNWELAENAHQKALKLEPKNDMYWNALGLVYFDQKKHKEAIKHYQKAIELNPRVPVYHANLGLSLGYLNKWKDCIEAYQKATQFDQSNPDYWNRLSIAAKKGKNNELSEMAFNKANKLNANLNSN